MADMQSPTNTALRRWRRPVWWLAGLAAAMAVALGTAVWVRSPFPGAAGETPVRSAASGPVWWERPPALTDEELAAQRYLGRVAHAWPESIRAEWWRVGGRQYGVSSIRYQAAFTGYAAAVLGLRTPAYPERTAAILRAMIERLLDRSAWCYVQGYWRDAPSYPDPCAFENIMYTGHLLQLVTLYEALTGDTRYRTEGFDLRWNEATVFHYDTLKLVEVTVRQMRQNPCGGVACEPGLIFFPCNNHPQIALMLLEGMGLGDWRSDRAKWEDWALSSYATRLGGGAFKLLYHADTGAFVPRGHPGLDGWSLLWYAPWARNPDTVRQIWAEAKTHLPTLAPATEHDTAGDKAADTQATCCNPVASVPDSAIASFVAPAARICGDDATAERLEAWIDQRLRHEEDGALWWAAEPGWRIGVSANRIISLGLRHGSPLCDAIQRPLPREWFSGALLTSVQPAELPVYQAYRDGVALVIELGGAPDEITLTLANVPAIAQVDGIAPDRWHYAAPVLRLHLSARATLRIVPQAVAAD